MKTLRLLVTKECDRACKGCCNKDWDLDSLPVVEHYNYLEVVITGGEPLKGDALTKVIYLSHYLNIVDRHPGRKIYVYTSFSFGVYLWWEFFDGFTLTLHEQKDVENFIEDNKLILESKQTNKSLRLNIFKGVELPENTDLSLWVVKNNIEWIKDYPLPENEVFMRLKDI